MTSPLTLDHDDPRRIQLGPGLDVRRSERTAFDGIGQAMSERVQAPEFTDLAVAEEWTGQAVVPYSSAVQQPVRAALLSGHSPTTGDGG